jgi:copper chaperone CopZ
MKKPNNQQIGLRIYDMHCGACALTVQNAIYKVPGVKRVKISRRRKQALVTVEPGSSVRAAELIAAVEATGYRAERDQ